jgi:hypothetical protein
MTRFALIDIDSGFAWGVADAESPAEACRLVDEDFGADGRDYEDHGPDSYADRQGRPGYIVHEVPAGFDVDDGQDKAQIAAVEAHPRVAIVLITDNDR